MNFMGVANMIIPRVTDHGIGRIIMICEVYIIKMFFSYKLSLATSTRHGLPLTQ